MPTPDVDAAPPGEQQVRAATRPVMWFSVVLLAALWLSLTRSPWPLPLVPGLLALAAIVLGIVGLVRMRRARMGGAMTVLVVLGLGLAATMALLTSVQAILWPLYADFYDCLDRALTHRAEDACVTRLEERAQTFLLDWAR